MQLAEKYRSAYPCAVVGVDVAAGEVGDDPAGHVEAFQKAKELGLKVTLHAGEVPAVSKIWGLFLVMVRLEFIPGRPPKSPTRIK